MNKRAYPVSITVQALGRTDDSLGGRESRSPDRNKRNFNIYFYVIYKIKQRLQLWQEKMLVK